MKKKLLTLSVCSFILAVAIFVLSYFMYHYMGPGGVWLSVWQPAPGKPFVTQLVSDLGVLFLFSSIMSAISAIIFFPNKK